jgi:hypothetical protein
LNRIPLPNLLALPDWLVARLVDEWFISMSEEYMINSAKRV